MISRIFPALTLKQAQNSMRIVAGKYKGQKLTEIKGRQIRPTSDRVREALFSILSPSMENALVLDLFAGTGALGLEAISRGASKSVFVDKSREAIGIIKKNIKLLKIQDEAEVVLQDVRTLKNLKAFSGQKFDLIFMDPPYNKGLLGNVFADSDFLDMIKDNSIIIAEHSSREKDIDKVSGFDRYDKRTYGEISLSFFKKKSIST